jgi:hypothetical protein
MVLMVFYDHFKSHNGFSGAEKLVGSVFHPMGRTAGTATLDISSINIYNKNSACFLS